MYETIGELKELIFDDNEDYQYHEVIEEVDIIAYDDNVGVKNQMAEIAFDVTVTVYLHDEILGTESFHQVETMFGQDAAKVIRTPESLLEFDSVHERINGLEI